MMWVIMHLICILVAAVAKLLLCLAWMGESLLIVVVVEICVIFG